MSGAVDYWCNAFTPDRRAVWEKALGDQGVPVKVRTDDEDSFCESEVLVERMDELGIATLVVPTCDLPEHVGPRDYEPVAARWDEMVDWTDAHPGRFVATWSLDPRTGMDGVNRAAEALEEDWCVGLHIHTHSWDRPLDHADYYPYYALAADEGVPVVMQAGTSGGLMPSECGRPIGIDRPAIYFADATFVLSHTGWPWVEEAIAMALKFPNVFIGTAAYPPRHWSPALVDFIKRPGRRKVVWGTGFPTVGHRHSLGQLDELGLSDEVRERLIHGNARAVFARLP